MKPYDYFLWDYINNCAYCTNPHTVQELQAEIEVIAGDHS
jgi:hypothetical protein